MGGLSLVDLEKQKSGRKMEYKVGAINLENDKTKFCLWAPFSENVELIIKGSEDTIVLDRKEKGYWEKEVAGAGPGTLYKFRLNGDSEYPDPASRSQPEDVHSWSQVIALDHDRGDDGWKGIAPSEMIIYELHVGAFTPEGTYAALTEKLDHLLELGVNTIELMPVSQFPGNRNWGYDGVYPYAAQHSYGGAEELKKMIDTCHQKGIAVVLDAVYNHLGPEGNYLSQFGPYFTEKYETPWGSAINYDDNYSDEVRNFFLGSALMWLEEFRFDGLRLDAIHEIIDRGARHFLKELRQKTDELEKKTGRSYVLIAESDLNDVEVINPYEKGGYNLEAQWVDDFHHSLHTLLTVEQKGYYKDYGKLRHLGKSFQQAFVYDGVYSDFRKRTIGNSPKGLAPEKFVVCIQNHDQVGNRMLGERLPELVSFEAVKLAAGVILTAPYIPMLFMGEEYAEDQRFQYFVSHGDPDLVKAVREGRKREFKYFNEEGMSEFPDPQSQETFNNSKLDWSFKENPDKKLIFEFYRELIRLRKSGKFDAFKNGYLQVKTYEDKGVLQVTGGKEKKLFAAFCFSSEEQEIRLPETGGKWKLLLASADKKWRGPKEAQGSLSGDDNLKLAPESLIICES